MGSPADTVPASAALVSSMAPQLTVIEAESWAAPSLVVETEAVLSRVEQLAEVVGEVRWTLTVAPGARSWGPKDKALPLRVHAPVVLGASIDQVVPAGLGRVSVAEAPRAIPAPALCTVTVNPMGSPADTVPASAALVSSMAPQLTVIEAESWAAPSLVVETEAVLSRVEPLHDALPDVRWTLTVAPGARSWGPKDKALPLRVHAPVVLG